RERRADRQLIEQQPRLDARRRRRMDVRAALVGVRRIQFHGLRQQQHSEYFGRRELSILEHDPEKWMPVFGKDHAQTLKHDPEKWMPVFGKDHAQTLKHDPEKWMPVFGKDHAQTKCRFNLIAFRFRAAAVPATAARCASHCPADSAEQAPPKFRSAGPGFSSTP